MGTDSDCCCVSTAGRLTRTRGDDHEPVGPPSAGRLRAGLRPVRRRVRAGRRGARRRHGRRGRRDAERVGRAADEDADRQEQLRQFAQCMRDNGVDVPDPDPAAGVRGFGALAERLSSDDPAVQAAFTACQSKLPNGGEPPKLNAGAARGLPGVRQCMRDNGVDLPDPGRGRQPAARRPLRGGLNPRTRRSRPPSPRAGTPSPARCRAAPRARRRRVEPAPRRSPAPDRRSCRWLGGAGRRRGARTRPYGLDFSAGSPPAAAARRCRRPPAP